MKEREPRRSRTARLGLLGMVAVGLVLVLAVVAGACQDTTEPSDEVVEAAPVPPWSEKANSVTLAVSEPSNGTHFETGQKPVITVTLEDAEGNATEKEDYSTLALYMYGPQETTKTVTASKLLNASEDRSERPHHYIDLLTNEDVEADGSSLEYTLQSIADEEPGTYTVALRVAVVDEALSQYFELVDIQIGTATVEAQIVDREKCAACHQGADTEQFYLHHVDPGRSPTGSPSIDSWPVRTCKACHNNDGYAAYRLPSDPDVRVPDPIVNRVHGVHNGSNLESVLNIGDEEQGLSGVFADYLDVHFPADVRNCSKCHADDRWKTEPSQLACGTCHDNTWFGSAASMPATAEAHPGGVQADDSACSSCHPADSGGSKAVAVAHEIEPPAFQHDVVLTMSAPANGTFYVAGETPQVIVTITDTATGAAIDPSTILEPADPDDVQANEWRRANLFVSGPRLSTKPVLTTAASHDEYDHYYANNDFRVMNEAADEDPRITRSATAITYQLDDVAGLASGTYTAFVETMPVAPLGGWGIVNFQVGTEDEEAKVATNCADCHEDTRMHASYFAVKFEPDICKNCHDYERQTAGSVGWATANNGFGAAPLSRRIHGVHFGHYLDKPEDIHLSYDYSGVIFPQDIRNCAKCHSEDTSGTWMTEPSRLACSACHDTDAAIGHTTLMTSDPTPADPWSGDEMETCQVCHGAGRDFSVDKVHEITDPYVPPYPREHED